MLSVRELSKTLPDGRTLFEAVNFELAAAQSLAVIGESGSGKSTLLNILAGLEPASSGEVMFSTTDLLSLDENSRTRVRRDHIGFVFQAFHVLPHMTVHQNVALPLLLKGTPIDGLDKRVREALRSVGLDQRGPSWPADLSGGELQRVAIARAIVHRPDVILADEPTGNLDPRTAAQMTALLLDQAAECGAAIVIVTHSPAVASACHQTRLLTPTGLALQ